ncbi:MAG: chemotaxis protein CheW [Betaproteobacteria bacterium]|nr:chemotaxis protein CheW [Betaproteobacteria bacterium]
MGALIRSERKAVQGAQEEALAQGQQYLTFTVAAEVFAIPISTIKEIIEYRKPTDVPMMPPYMRGIINLRGRVVPVIDLSVRFGRDASEVSRRTCFVILEVEQQDERHDIGVVVDAVSAVIDIADADIEPAPGFGANLRADFISGMGKMGEKFAIILDIAKVLSIDELALLTGGAEMQALPAAQASAQHA